MKAYDVFVPLYYGDNTAVEPKKFQGLQNQLLKHFEGLTFYPQPNEGFWKVGHMAYRDEIVVYRVAAKNARQARRLLKQLKETWKRLFRQDEILIVEREMDML